MPAARPRRPHRPYCHSFCCPTFRLMTCPSLAPPPSVNYLQETQTSQSPGTHTIQDAFRLCKASLSGDLRCINLTWTLIKPLLFCLDCFALLINSFYHPPPQLRPSGAWVRAEPPLDSQGHFGLCSLRDMFGHKCLTGPSLSTVLFRNGSRGPCMPHRKPQTRQA